ncbi:hypothetical protein OZN62_10050 [Aurantiacibacter sp. MUD11]|nr:hypothetical protein [Aurantiacibacter sp. MUD11]WAT17271.1 hypothetical protein OZN62_10050 [Aurantiacibacter sp. MUD11]
MSKDMSREERLAEQLRANLKRRKSQARAKATRESQELSKNTDES